MKRTMVCTFVAVLTIMLVAAVAFLLRGGSPAGDQAHGKDGKPPAIAGVDERRAAHRAAEEARRVEREAYRKMSPEERRQFREKKREEFTARHRDPRGKDQVDKSGREEQEELRSAALKARAEYEETMGEATAASYRRRSVGYWMNRVRRGREHSAARGRQSQSENNGVDAGASAADGQKHQTKGKTE